MVPLLRCVFLCKVYKCNIKSIEQCTEPNKSKGREESTKIVESTKSATCLKHVESLESLEAPEEYREQQTNLIDIINFAHEVCHAEEAGDNRSA